MLNALPRADRPFHVEAYPRLDLREAHKRARAGQPLVIWYDQTSALVGMAQLSFSDGATLVIAARFRSLPYIVHGEVHDELTCQIISRAGSEDDVLTRCAHCLTSRRSIVFRNDKWLCRDCQLLAYRSTIVSRHVRDSERIDELKAMIGEGRPRYMHARAHYELRRELLELEHMLDGSMAEAPLHQQWLLTPHWMSPPPDPQHLAAFEEGRASDARKDILDLRGKPLFHGPSLKGFLESKVRSGVYGAYEELRATMPKVSALQVRRRLAATISADAVPTLGQPTAINVAATSSRGVLVAALSVPFEGDPDLLRPVIVAPRPSSFPLARVIEGEIVISARFSLGNAAFVPALLYAELDFLRQGLVRQRQAVRDVHVADRHLLKRVVDGKLPKVKPRRHRR